MTSQFCVNYDPKYTLINGIPSGGIAKPPDTLPEKPLFGYIQPWNNFCPECTITDGCANLPCQVSNIKAGGIYAGIEVECNKWMEMAAAEALLSVEHGGGDPLEQL